MTAFARRSGDGASLRRIVLGALIAAASLLQGCAMLATHDYAYQPTEATAGKISVAQARQTLSRTLPYCYDASNRRINFLGYRTDAIGETKFFVDHYSFVFKGGSEYRAYYKDMRNLRLDYKALGEWPDYFVLSWNGRIVNTAQKKEFQEMNGSCNMIYDGGPMPLGEGSKVVIDAILRLKMEFDEAYGPAAEDKFRQAASQYMASQNRPALPSQSEIYGIQANAAAGKKNFETAANLYAKALDTAPWWAEGHFNMALILHELSSDDAAIIEMMRYLYLRPDAPNAQLVKTKIAEWGTPEY